VTQIKVTLRISPPVDEETASSSYMSIDSWKRQVTVHDPTYALGLTAPSQRKAGAPPPKLFAFDNVFTADDSLVSDVILFTF
jgi:hypothetical protein